MLARDIINAIVSLKPHLTSYLEIGTTGGPGTRGGGSTICNIDGMNIKHGVDVVNGRGVTHLMTSDMFFKNECNNVYDIIFVDGLHECWQAIRDIYNALDYISDYGYIFVHDCSPPTEWHQRPSVNYVGGEHWNGTVWKGFVHTRYARDDIRVRVVDEDWGVGVINKTKEKEPKPNVSLENALTFKTMAQNREEILNLMSFENFIDEEKRTLQEKHQDTLEVFEPLPS